MAMPSIPTGAPGDSRPAALLSAAIGNARHTISLTMLAGSSHSTMVMYQNDGYNVLGAACCRLMARRSSASHTTCVGARSMQRDQSMQRCFWRDRSNQAQQSRSTT